MGKNVNPVFKVVSYILVVIFLFVYLFPLFYIVNTSLKSAQDYLLHPTSLTTTFSFSNFAVAWQKANFGTYIWNSILYTTVCTLTSLFMSVMIAFPISRK